MKPETTKSIARYFVIATAVGAVAWLVLAWLVMPGMIRAAYAGEGWSLLARAMSGREQTGVDRYLEDWARMRIIGMALILGGGLVGYVLITRSRAMLQASSAWAGRMAAATEGHVRPQDLVLAAFTLGAIAGVIELTILNVRADMFGYRGWRLTPLQLWMTPLGNSLVYVCAAVLLSALGRILPTLRARPVAGFLMGWLLFGHLLDVVFPSLHWAAILILGVGLSARLNNLVGPFSSRALRRASFAVVVGLFLTWGAQQGMARVAFQRSVAALPAIQESRPNVLLIVWDNVRAASLSLYGHDRPTTPVLDSLSAFGTTYDRAYATAPWTLPSHVSLFTGLLPRVTTADWKVGLNEEPTTLAEVLQEQGYVTAGFGANYHFLNRFYGLQRGFMEWRVFPMSLGQFARSSWLLRGLAFWLVPGIDEQPNDIVRKNARVMNRDFLAWVDAHDTRPFFAFLNYFDAHVPYVTPIAFDSALARSWQEFPNERTGVGSDVLDSEDAYERAIRFLDVELGNLLTSLRERGELDNTVIVITSDHGESFGEQDPLVTGHTWALYVQSLQIPLVLVYPPSVAAGVRSVDAVGIRAVPRTILRLAGISDTAFRDLPLLPEIIEGASPESYETGPLLIELTKTTEDPKAPVRFGDMQSLIVDSLQYIRRGDGAEELFDLVADPDGRIDLAQDPEQESELEAMRARLHNLLEAHPRPRDEAGARSTSGN